VTPAPWELRTASLAPRCLELMYAPMLIHIFGALVWRFFLGWSILKPGLLGHGYKPKSGGYRSVGILLGTLLLVLGVCRLPFPIREYRFPINFQRHLTGLLGFSISDCFTDGEFNCLSLLSDFLLLETTLPDALKEDRSEIVGRIEAT